MPKRIREEHTYLAPGIDSWRDENYHPVVFDERTEQYLNPNDIEDKITIYERQVKDWFLNRATELVDLDNYGFIVLMLCLSYLEGIEQYRTGEKSNGRSSQFFVNSLNRLYPDTFNRENLTEIYREARCGLFHNGMVEGRIVINNGLLQPIQFPDRVTIKINPRRLLQDIKIDFDSYLDSLRDINNIALRDNFNLMFSNL